VKRRPRIGVLALQGAFREHARMLRAAGADVVEVRLPEQLEGLDGLVIPGGESTSILRLAALYGLDEAVRSFDGPIFGTCAGMILVDRDHLGLVDLVVDRNAYGRQVASFEADLALDGEERPFRGVFIRAPRLRVLLRDGRVLVAAFHPELTDDSRIHERFLELVTEATSVRT
jgi:5'-phosphate synthase pdxT subunit